MGVHHAVGISCQRNSGYRPSRVNIMAQSRSTPDPFPSPTHLSIRRGRATTTHYIHRQVSLHHAVGISCQRNSGYRPSRVNIMAQSLSTPDPFPSPTHLSIRRGRATTAHYIHRQVSLMVSRNTTVVLSLGLRIWPACETGLSVGMRREHAPPKRIKIKIKMA